MSFEKTGHHSQNIHRQHDDWDEVHNQLLAIQKKSLAVSDPNDADEKEADEVAKKVAGGDSAEIHGTGGTINPKGESTGKIQRQPIDELEKANEYVREIRQLKKPTQAPDAGEKATLALGFHNEKKLVLTPEDIAIIIQELWLTDPRPTGSSVYLSDALTNASDADFKKIVKASLTQAQDIDVLTATPLQVENRLAVILIKENEERLATLKSAPDQAKALAAVTLAEGASAEEQDISVGGGLKEMAWVYRNYIKRDGFMAGLKPSNAFYDKGTKHMQAHCRSWMEYFGVTNPDVIALYDTPAKAYSETTKKTALDVLEFVARDVWQPTPDSLLTNPMADFYGQGYYLDLNNNIDPWIYARKFVYLWAKALKQANPDKTTIDYLNDNTVVKNTSFISETEFNSMMHIVGGVKVRTFLYNTAKIKKYLSSIPNPNTRTKTELPLPKPTDYQIKNNIFPAGQQPDSIPELDLNNEAYEPKPVSIGTYMIDDKSVQVKDDLTLDGILVNNNPVKVMGTQLHGYDGSSFYNQDLAIAQVDGKPVYSQCQLFSGGNEVLMQGDPRVKIQGSGGASLMLYKGFLYYAQLGIRMNSANVTSLSIEGNPIPNTQ